MIPQNSLPKIDSVIGEIVQHLSIAPHIRAIILIGSYARGDTNEYSDIDLVLITDLFLPRSKFYAILPSELNIKELSLLPYPLEIFTKLYMEGSLFIAHVLKEGLVLYDEGCYVNLRRISFKVTRESLLLQWKMLKQRVRLYDNLSMFGEVFVDCLSHMYSIMKNAAIITLAMNGEMSFNKNNALERFSHLFPKLKDDINELLRLKAFSLIWSKGVSISRPFTPINCREQTERYLCALRKIISTVELHEFGAQN